MTFGNPFGKAVPTWLKIVDWDVKPQHNQNLRQGRVNISVNINVYANFYQNICYKMDSVQRILRIWRN